MPKRNGEWFCSRMGCGNKANYHVAGKIHLYYCDHHWSVRLGHVKEKKKVHKKEPKAKGD